MDHDAGTEKGNLVSEIVGTQEFRCGKFVSNIEPYGKIGVGCKTRNGIGRTGLEHEPEKEKGRPGNLK